jgi:hypothetical protein
MDNIEEEKGSVSEVHMTIYSFSVKRSQNFDFYFRVVIISFL